MRILLLVPFIACASKPSPFGYTDGSRLQASTYVHKGGAELWSIRDQTLGDCEFIRVREAIVCAPIASAGTYFSDAACKVPVLAIAACAEPPSHVSLFGNRQLSACEIAMARDDAVQIRKVAKEASGQIYLRTPFGCSATEAPLRSFTLSAPIDLEDAVSGTIESATVDGFLIDSVKGSDGSKFLLHARDEKLGPCEFGEIEGVAKCLPTNVATYGGFFESRDCAGTEVAHTKLACDAAAIRVDDALFSLGETVSPGDVTTPSTLGYCSFAPLSFKFHRQGPPFNPDRLPALEQSASKHEGLGVQQYLSPSGALLAPATTFIDPNRGACLPQPLSNGTIVCAPQKETCAVDRVLAGEEDITESLPTLELRRHR